MRSKLDDEAEGCVGGVQAAGRPRKGTAAGPEAIAGIVPRSVVAAPLTRHLCHEGEYRCTRAKGGCADGSRW